jgi:hypothetical protein
MEKGTYGDGDNYTWANWAWHAAQLEPNGFWPTHDLFWQGLETDLAAHETFYPIQNIILAIV